MKKVYISIPYTGMEESSYKQATRATAEAMKMGYNPFSPITHSHPLPDYGVPSTWEFWKNIDFDWIEECDELWVIIPEEGLLKVPEAVGVMEEMEYARKLGIPIRHFEYSDNELKEATLNVTYV